MYERRLTGAPRIFVPILAIAIMASACSSSLGQSTTESANHSAEAEKLVTEALGTQAVQDFVVYIDLLASPDPAGDVTSYYDEVLAKAEEGAGEPVGLTAAFTFAATNSLGGRIVDPGGTPLPSLSLDFGLLGITDEGSNTVRDELLDRLDDGPLKQAIQDLADQTARHAGLLVEIVTADTTLSRTHLSSGDLAQTDMAFISSVQPGGNHTSIYVFGQTLPGVLSEESDLTPHELFAYRWNNGQVRFFGDADGIVTTVDETQTPRLRSDFDSAWSQLRLDDTGPVNAVRAVRNAPTGQQSQAEAEAPGMLETDMKAALVRAAFAAGTADGAVEATRKLYRARSEGSDLWEGYTESVAIGDLDIVADMEGDLFIADSDTRIDLGRLIAYTAAYRGAEACLATALTLIINNRSGPNAEAASEDPAINNLLAPCWDRIPEPPSRDDNVAGTFGDIHVRNFDGWDYDNQAAGEFVMFDNGTATVQIRTEPMDDVVASGFDVSVTTAVGVGIDGHSVSMHNNGELFVDGKLTHLGRGATLEVGNGAVVWSGGEWNVVWPDGTKVRININLPDMLVFVTAAPGNVTGMFGNLDGDPANDWFTRAGQQLDPGIRFAEDFYSTYVDSWRVGQEESLLHYASGESTETFTIEGFPRAPATTDMLDPVAKSEALEACAAAGITRRDVLDDCILDVALTGDLSFTYGAYLTQSSTVAAPIEPVSTTPSTNPPPVDANDTALSVGSLSIGFGAEPAVVAENSFAPTWQCQATDTSFFATSRFMETADRQFNITVQYTDGSATGADDRFAFVVELNSQPYAWMQTALQPPPGSIDMLSFDGSTLAASGTAFLNEPINASLFPASILPPGSAFEPFALQASC